MENNMGYFESNGWKQDYTNLLKALLLISKRMEDLTLEVSNISDALNKIVPVEKDNNTD